MRVYISGALAASSNLAAARAKYELTADLLRSRGVDAYLPHKSTDPGEHSHITPKEVFERDCAAMLASDIVVAYLDEPSHGVGAEIALALQHDKYVIATWRRGTNISRFLLGLLASSANVEMVEYADISDVVVTIRGGCVEA